MLNDFIIRLFFETIYFSLIIFLVLFYLKLSRIVIRYRREFKVSLGSKKNEKLERVIRAHANFNEHVPLGIVLSFFTYFNNFIILSCIALIFLFVGRILHAKSIIDINEKKIGFNARIIGMRLTFYSHLISILGIILYLIQMIYYNLKNVLPSNT